MGYVLADKYRVDALVAEGGFGLVYQAHHLTLNKALAIKILRVPEEFNDAARADVIARFMQEAQTVAQLDHPAIVRVLDSGVAVMPSGVQAPWIVLDWIDGETLGQHLEARAGRGGRAPVEALEFLRPLLEALAYAH